MAGAKLEDQARRDDLTTTLILQLRDGQTQAGNLLDQLYRPAIRRFCYGYLYDRHEAEDATQEVFYKVLADRNVPDSFRAYIYRIARNHCIDGIRARRRRGPADELPSSSQLDAELTGNITRLVKREARGRVFDLLAQMSPAAREVLMLRYTEQLSRAEIADVLGVPEKVVKSRLYEAVEKLRHETGDTGTQS